MNFKLWLHFLVAAVAIPLSLIFFIYPAFVIGAVMLDSELKGTGQSRMVPGWFESAAGRYYSWADTYLGTEYAKSVDEKNVPATEWPMFGSVFFLVTANDLHKQGKIDINQPVIRKALEKALQIVVSPVTATWVKSKWGDGYLRKENLFYRMLLIMGLSAYEEATGDMRHRSLMSGQRLSLSKELEQAEWTLLDDYPQECYPSDVLWAVTAIQRAARLEGAEHNGLVEKLVTVLDGQVKTSRGLPAFQADSRSGRIVQNARGSGNSGIITFAAELAPMVAGRWYQAHEAHFWKDNRWAAGFTELPRGSERSYMDVDSGPVMLEFGSVASAFGIGAAKAVGRIDHAVILTLESIAVSWPTPFGFLVPGLMGWLSVGSWSLGETALLFSMTRPVYVAETVSFSGPAPWIVWLLMAVYFGIGVFFIVMEIHGCIRLVYQRVPPLDLE